MIDLTKSKAAFEEAKKWYMESAKSGNEDAKKMLRKMNSEFKESK